MAISALMPKKNKNKNGELCRLELIRQAKEWEIKEAGIRVERSDGTDVVSDASAVTHDNCVMDEEAWNFWFWFWLYSTFGNTLLSDGGSITHTRATW